MQAVATFLHGSCSRAGAMDIHPVTVDRLAGLADLFDSNSTTRGCWCMWFIASSKERRANCRANWGAGNRARFEAFAATTDPPAGLLAYQDETPVGWCALGPRLRYPSAIGPRSIMLKERNPNEDDDVWLVPCFFVRVGFRRSGITYTLLTAAVDLAQRSGAKAVEGFPLSVDTGVSTVSSGASGSSRPVVLSAMHVRRCDTRSCGVN
jgi:hypothetical protein